MCLRVVEAGARLYEQLTCVKRDRHQCQKRPASVSKETSISVKRTLVEAYVYSTTEAHHPHYPSSYTYVTSSYTDVTSSYSTTEAHHPHYPANNPMHTAKQPYLYSAKEPYDPHYPAKQPYQYRKTTLFIRQKSPIHTAKEPYSYGKRAL